MSPMRADFRFPPGSRVRGDRPLREAGATWNPLVSTRPSTSAEAAQPRGKGPQDYVPPPTATPGLRSVVAQARDRDVRCPTGRGPCSYPPLCSCPWGGRGAERPFSGSRGQGRAAAAAGRGSSRTPARPRTGGWGTARRVAGCAHFGARLGPGPHAGAQARKVLAPRGRWDVRSEDAALHWFFSTCRPHAPPACGLLLSLSRTCTRLRPSAQGEPVYHRSEARARPRAAMQ